MEGIGFKASIVENCPFYKHNVVFVIYVDNGIFASKNRVASNKPIHKIGGKKILMTKGPWTITFVST